MIYGKNSPTREMHSNTGLPQEARKISNKQFSCTPKESRRRTKPKVNRRKKMIKNGAEINDIESQKQYKIFKKKTPRTRSLKR